MGKLVISHWDIFGTHVSKCNNLGLLFKLVTVWNLHTILIIKYLQKHRIVANGLCDVQTRGKHIEFLTRNALGSTPATLILNRNVNTASTVDEINAVYARMWPVPVHQLLFRNVCIQTSLSLLEWYGSWRFIQSASPVGLEDNPSTDDLDEL